MRFPVDLRALRQPLFDSLSGRLFAALALTALLSVAGLGLAAFQAQREALEAQLNEQLTAIASLKVEQINQLLAERQADVHLLAVNRLNQDHLAVIQDPTTPADLRTAFAAFLTDNLVGLQESRPGYTEISFIDPHGTVIVSTNQALLGQSTPHDVAFAQTMAAVDGFYVQDIHFDPSLDQTAMAFGHTMVALDPENGEVSDEIIGVALTIVNMDMTLYPLLTLGSGLGETGETYLVRAEGDGALLLSQLRLAPTSALSLRLPGGTGQGEAALLALRQRAGGIDSTIDYRGEPVLAAYRHIAALNWGFVVKKDLSEAFAPINDLARRLVLLALGVLIAVTVVAGGLSRSLTQPLSALVAATRQVAQGDLSPSIPLHRADEFGELAQSFQSMVQALERSAHQREATNAILRLLNATPEVLDVFPGIAARLQELTASDGVNLVLLDPDQTHYLFTDEEAVGAAAGRIPLAHSAISRQILRGEPYLSPDLRQDLDFPAERLLHEQGLRARISWPLSVGPQVVGALSLGWRQAAGYDVTVLPLIEQAAGAIALALERSRLYAEATRRANELQHLGELSVALRATYTIPEMLPIILGQAVAIAGEAVGTIYLLDHEAGILTAAASHPADHHVSSSWLRLDQGITGHVARTGEVYVTRDLHQDPRRVSLPEYAPLLQSVGSMVALPLRAVETIVGVLNIGLVGENRLTGDKIEVLTALAEIAGNALQRANLLQTLEARVAERTQALAAANEQLQELDRLKSKFVSDVSHELRTPVTNLRLYLNLLAHGAADKRDRYLLILQEQTTRLGQLIEDILDMSRLEASHDRLVLAPVDLNQVVSQVVAAHAARAELKGLRLNYRPGEDLPLIMAERSQLGQVATNLVANAISYTPEGHVEVHTAYNPAAQRVCLEVCDTGLGIEATDLPHLFERFYRGSRNQVLGLPGTGLGLSIVQEIVRAHHGEIQVQSTPGQGTGFTVWLPVQPPAD